MKTGIIVTFIVTRCQIGNYSAHKKAISLRNTGCLKPEIAMTNVFVAKYTHAFSFTQELHWQCKGLKLVSTDGFVEPQSQINLQPLRLGTRNRAPDDCVILAPFKPIFFETQIVHGNRMPVLFLHMVEWLKKVKTKTLFFRSASSFVPHILIAIDTTYFSTT